MYDALACVRRLAAAIREHIGADEAGPDTDVPFEIADYWIVRYFEWAGYTYYPASKSARLEEAKLAERGWSRRWRAPRLVDGNRRPPMPASDPLARDPVAGAARNVCLYQTLVLTPGELLGETGRITQPGEPGTVDPPTNPQELHDHLVKIARPLQTRRLFVDEEKEFFFLDRYGTLPRDRRKYCRHGYLVTEYWENAKTGQGLWAFTAMRSGTRRKGAANAWSLWQKVKILERVAEHPDEPLEHGLYEKEGAELRQAIESIAPADRWLPFGDSA